MKVKIKNIIKIIIFTIIVMFMASFNIESLALGYPNLQKIGADDKYLINFDVYKQNNNLWCIQEGSHLTSYHTCIYKEVRFRANS